MRPTGLSCQVCLLDCPSISSFKKHLRNGIHQRKRAELFQKAANQPNCWTSEVSKGPGYFFPGHLSTIDILVKRPKHPLLGLSLVTLCLSSEDGSLFYLCHSCEESVSDICKHFNCREHLRNYFLYTNPNVLRFSWISSPKIYTILDPVALSKINKNLEQHTGKLQVLDLPPDVFETVKGSSYVKVMHTLSQNDNLLKQITAARPKRMAIQTYLGTPNGHSLLGLEHLVECSCEDQTDRRVYLCTVCKLTQSEHKIINHLLGFHHIRCYINAWHPSTLMTYSCYGYDNVFHDTMRDFAKQMEEIHGTTISDMKQVVLRPDMFSSLEGRSYIDALAMLEHWRKLRKESSLITNITPGEKLVQKRGCKLKTSSASHDPAASMKDSDAAAEKQEAEKKQPSDTETVDVPDQVKAGSTSHHDPVSMEERVVSTEKEETAHRSGTETSETKKRRISYTREFLIGLRNSPAAQGNPDFLLFEPEIVMDPSQSMTPSVTDTCGDQPVHPSIYCPTGYQLVDPNTSLVSHYSTSYCPPGDQLVYPSFYGPPLYHQFYPSTFGPPIDQRVYASTYGSPIDQRVYASTYGPPIDQRVYASTHGPLGQQEYQGTYSPPEDQQDYPSTSGWTDDVAAYDCWRCCQNGHWAQYCPNSAGKLPPDTCFKCGQQGHRVRFCPIFTHRGEVKKCPTSTPPTQGGEVKKCPTSTPPTQGGEVKKCPTSTPPTQGGEVKKCSTSTPQGGQVKKCPISSSPTQGGEVKKCPTSTPPAQGGESPGPTSMRPFRSTWLLRCQVCMSEVKDVTSHLRGWEHIQNMHNIFVTEADNMEFKLLSVCNNIFYKNITTECQYITRKSQEKRHEPVIGLLHIVTCVCSRAVVMPLCICLVCQSLFPVSRLRIHLNDPVHIKRTLMHKNSAWGLLPFAWKGNTIKELLTSMAWEEERAQGPEHKMLKLIDVPKRVFSMFSDDYQHVCRILNEHFSLKTSEVPKMATLTYPQLGVQFLVRHKSDFGPWRSLCLLCEKTLDKCESHVYSFEHVRNFLDKAHPGSLDSEAMKNPDLLLDLAKQAAEIHPTGHIQEVTLSVPILQSTYRSAVLTLQRKKEFMGEGNLIPVLPVGEKLEALKETDRVFGSDTSPEITKKLGGQANKERPDVKDPTPQPPDVKDPTPQPPDVKDPTPQPPDVKDATPQPIPVEKEAVLEKDSHVHKPGDMKGPTQNTSVERRADKETLKQSTEGQKTEKDQATGQPFKFQWLRVISKSQKATHEREDDAGEEARTEATSVVGRDTETECRTIRVEKEAVPEKESHVLKPDEKMCPTQNSPVEHRADSTSVDRDTLKQSREEQRTEKKETRKGDVGEEDITPRVRKGSQAEMENRTSEKRRRSEHARPEVAGKRQRLCDAEEREEKIQKSSREEGGQTAEALSDVAAETKTPDQCVDHEGKRYGCDDFLLPPDIPQLDSDIDNMMELLDPSMLIALRKEKDRVAERELQSNTAPQPAVSEVTHNIQVSPTHPQGLQTPPSTSDCQPRPSPLISDVQDKTSSSDLQQPRVESATNRCHLQVTPEDSMDLQVTPEDIMDLQVTPEDIMDPSVTNLALWRYLNRTDKSQPVIGLSMIEFEARNHYHCQCCSKDFHRSFLMNHITSNNHRYNYIPQVEPPTDSCHHQVTIEDNMDARWSFLSNTERTEPVIGLSMIEFSRKRSHCQCCSTDFLRSNLTSHITSKKHRYNYIRMAHPHMTLSLNQVRARELHVLAQQVERDEESGRLKPFSAALQQPQLGDAEERTACQKIEKTCEEEGDGAGDMSSICPTSETNPHDHCVTHRDSPAVSEVTHNIQVSPTHPQGLQTPPSTSDCQPRPSPLISDVQDKDLQQPQVEPPTNRCHLQVTPEDIVDPAVTNPALWRFLNSPERTEPVIGLSMMTEYQWPEHSARNYFHCDCCSRDIASDQHMAHIISASHSYNYITKVHPHLVHELSWIGLGDLAQRVERDEGWGRWKVTVHQSLKAHAKSPLKADGASTTNKMNDDLKRILISKTVAELTELSKSCLTEDAAGTVSKGNSVVAATSHTDGETTTTSDALATDSKLAVGSQTTAPTSESTAAELHLNQTSSSETPASGVRSAKARGMAAAHPCHTQLTPLTPTVSRTTANPKPTTRVSSATPDESTATISKCTPSTTTSEPSTTVCHPATVVSKPTAATFSNTTPDVSKPSSSTTASKPSTNAGLSEALWETLWQDFEAAVEASSDSGNETNERPDRLATGSEPSPLHALPLADAWPEGPQSCDVQLESSRDYRTQPMDLQEARTRPVAPPDAMTQPVAPQDSRTQPVNPMNTRTKAVAPPDHSTQPVAPQYSSTQPVAPQYSSTQPVAPQYSSTQPVALQYSSTQPGALQYSSTQPEALQYSSTQPVALQYSSTQPVALQYSSTQPVAPQYSSTQPVALQYSSTQPVALQYSSTQPVALRYSSTQPEALQYSSTQPAALRYSSTQPVALQYSSTQPVALQCSSTQPAALRYSSTQPVALQYSSTQPVAAQDSIKQEGIPEDSKEWQQAPQNPGSRQEAPRCSATRPWPPQCSAGTHDITSSLSLAGITIDSRLSCYLRAMSEADRNRVVGLSSVLEYQCGEMSKNETLFPFYMCRSCQETVQLKHICEHITSIHHQLNYMWKEFPHIMTPIRDMENWSEKQKEEGYGYAIYKIAEREKFTQMDAEVIPLDKSSYHRVRVAPFREGIHILEDILGHQNVTSSCPPADQQPPEATNSKENVRLTRSLTERPPFGAAVVKTEPTPEQMSDRTHPERLATLNAHNSTITVTIKQEVKQEDHAHSCFSGHAEMREAVKHGLDYVSLIEDGETVKRRRIEGPSGPYSNVSSPAGLRPSPALNQEVRVKTETTSIPTTLDSLVTRREPSQMLREKVLELNLECPPTTNATSTRPSTTPRFIDSSLLGRECPTLQDQEARVKVEPGQCPSPQNRAEAESTSAPTALVSQAPRCEPSQTRPRPKLEQILNSLTILASSNFMLECPPTNPVSTASTEPSTTPWFIDSSLADLEPEPELNSALSEVKQASPLPMLTPVPLSPPANKDLPPSEPITSIVDVNDISRFISSVRAEQSGKDVPPGRASPENAIEIVTKTSTSTQTSVGHVKPRMQMDSECRIAIAKPNQSVNVLKRKLAKPKPAADDDIWDYENRQFTPESCRGDDVICDDRSLEGCYRAADPAGDDGPVTSNHPAARAARSTELQPWGDRTVQFNCNLDTTSATVMNPNNTAQVMQASACPPPFHIGVGPYMGGPVTAVNPDPTNQQFNGYDHRINQPTVSTVNTSDSLPAAGYGPPSVYPYNQVTQNFYFPHGYPYGPGPAGDSRAPEQQHAAVFSQYEDYSDDSAGGSYAVHTPEQAWLDLQRQQQPPPQ